MARKHCHINELEPPFSSLLPEFGAGRQARLAFPDLRAATPDPLHHITTALRDAFRAYRRSGPGPAVEADPDGGFLGHSGNSNHSVSPARLRRKWTFNADPWSIDCTRPIGNIGRAILL